MAIDFVNPNPPNQERRDITDDLHRYSVSKVVLSPTRWASYTDPTPLTWHQVKFEKESLEEIPDNEYGIYTFVVCAEVASHPHCSYLLYLGKAEKQSLRARIRQYFYETANPKGRGTIQDMILDWASHLHVCYSLVNETGKISALENALLEALVPPLNQEYKGVIGQAIRAWRQR